MRSRIGRYPRAPGAAMQPAGFRGGRRFADTVGTDRETLGRHRARASGQTGAAERSVVDIVQFIYKRVVVCAPRCLPVEVICTPAGRSRVVCQVGM